MWTFDWYPSSVSTWNNGALAGEERIHCAVMIIVLGNKAKGANIGAQMDDGDVVLDEDR